MHSILLIKNSHMPPTSNHFFALIPTRITPYHNSLAIDPSSPQLSQLPTLPRPHHHHHHHHLQSVILSGYYSAQPETSSSS